MADVLGKVEDVSDNMSDVRSYIADVPKYMADAINNMVWFAFRNKGCMLKTTV